MKFNTLKTLKDAKINIPDFLEVDINNLDRLKKLNKDKIYAVRSNCFIEDNKDRSHAGEFKTLLNIKYQDLERAIYEVKSSYKGKLGTVIIQEMVDSDISGVAFSINPIGILNEIVIVYGNGLGCNIVDDRIESNTIYYNRDDEKYYTSISNKEIEMEDDIIRDLIDNILKIEDILKYSCDIEYAIKNGKIFILQARPITGLDIKEQIILDNSNIVESYPGIVLPLTQSFGKEIYSEVFRNIIFRLSNDMKLVNNMDIIFKNMVDSYNGRMYYRISNWYEILRLLPFSNSIIKIWQNSLGVENRNIENIVGKKIKLKTKLNIINSFLKYLGNRTPIEMHKLNRYFKDNLYEYNRQVKKADSIEELIEVYENIKKDLGEKWDITLVNDMYTFIYSHFSNKKHISDIKDIASKKPLIDLNKLIDIKNNFGLDSKEYLIAKKRFIRLYGDRCAGELKLETKTYRTNEELLDELVKFGNKINVQTKNRYRHHIIERRAILGIKNREESRLNRSRIFGITREIMLKIGKLMVEQDLLSDTKDIFYLNLDEIRNTQDYKELVYKRKVEYEYYKSIPTNKRVVLANKIINKPIENIKISYNSENKNMLYGLATSYGKITGKVIKVYTPDVKLDVKDKIIVAESTDPGWVYMIERCKGIIVERGSLLSHTAIISRELKKPAIVNVKNAMNILKDNDIVELDTKSGRITVIGDSYDM